MNALGRIVCVAATELRMALRSRRALVTALLFVAIEALVMYGTISAFAAMEREVMSALRLPNFGEPGAVTTVLWKSQPFMRIIRHIVGDNLVFADIVGRHPVALAYAFFIFQIVPLLTLLVSAARVAEDCANGAARYWLVRVTRAEWSIGLLFGEAMMLAFALLAGALTAWGVAAFRMPGTSGAALLPDVLDWSARAWLYAFGWLGLFMGVSHIARSGGKALALSILAMIGAFAWTRALGNFAEDLPFLPHLDALVPQTAQAYLWRRSFSAVLFGAVHLAALSFLFLSIGSAVFRRRDV